MMANDAYTGYAAGGQVGTAPAPAQEDAYTHYVNTGQMGNSAPPMQLGGGGMGGMGSAPQLAAPPQLPYYPEEADAALAKAKASGKPVDGSALSDLPSSFWVRNAPLFAAHGMGSTKLAHEEAKAAFLQQAQAYNAKILAAHQAQEAAANPNASHAKGFFANAGEGLLDAGRVAGDSIANGLLETGRLAGGGIPALYDSIHNDFSSTPSHAADAYFKWYDGGNGAPGGTPETQRLLAQDQSAASQRSPFWGGVVGGAAGSIATAGVAPTMEGVQNERNAGGSVAQQEGMLGLGTVANTATLALPGGGNAAETALASAAEKGLVGDAAKAAITKAVGRNVLASAGKSAAINAGVGAGQTLGAAAIDSKANPLGMDSLKSIGMQAAIGLVLGAAHGHMALNDAKAVAGRLVPGKPNADGSVILTDPKTGRTYTAPQGMPGATDETPPPGEVEGVQPDGSTVVRDPATGHVTEVPAGEGIDPKVHANYMAGAAQKASQAINGAKKRFAGLSDGQKLPELMANAKALAMRHDPTAWAKMTPVQRAQVEANTARVLNKSLKVAGVDDAATALETDAATAKPAAAQVAETGQPDGEGDQPQVRTGAAPNQVPGMEDGTLPPAGATPEDAQKIAEQAMADNENPGQLSDLVQPDAAGRIRAQATSPDEIAAHNRVDEALKQGGSGLTNANLDIMPYRSKVARLQKIQTDRITAALDTRRSDSNLSPQAQALHDTVDAQLEPLRRNVLGSKLPKRSLDKMTLQEKVAKIKELQGKHLEGTMTPDDIRQMLEQHASGQAAAEPATNPLERAQPPAPPGAGETTGPDGTRHYDPTSARAFADTWAKDTGLEAKGPAGDNTPLPLDNSGDVHLTGGVKLKKAPSDGSAIAAIALDKRFPRFVKIGNHTVDMHWAVAQHEMIESWLMHQYGEGYVEAHRPATVGENRMVEQRYPGLSAADYQAAAKPYIEHIEEATKGKAQDPTLDGAPQKGIDLGKEDDAARTETPTANEVNNPLDKRAKKAAAPEQGSAPGPNETRSASTERARPSEPVQDVVQQMLGKRVTADDIADVRALIENSREGDTQPLLDRVQEMVDDGHISKTEAAILRKQGRPQPLDVEHETTPAAAVDNVARTAAEEAAKADPLKSDAQNAASVVKRLRIAFHGNKPALHAVDFFEWAVKQNPALLRGVADIRLGKGHGVTAGGFEPVTRILRLATDTELPTDTVVHELMHAAETMLPEPLRRAISAERRAEIDRLAETAAPHEKAFFDAVRQQADATTPEGNRAGSDKAAALLSRLSGDKVSPERHLELYGLTNDSEYWATRATKMLEEQRLPKKLTDVAKQWLRDFAGHIKKLVTGADRQSAIERGLKHILGDKEGTQHATTDLAEYDALRTRYADQPEAFSPVADAAPVEKIIRQRPADTIEDASPITRATVLREFLANAAIGLQKFDQSARALGLKLGSLYDGQDGMLSMRSWFRKLDEFRAVEPVKQWVADNAHLYDLDPVKAVSKIGEFFQAHHQVTERMPQNWAEHVPLDNGMEIERDRILQETLATKNDAEGQKSMARLLPLAKQHASIPFEEWSGANTPKGEKPSLYADMSARLKELAAEGINPKTMAPLNKLIQDMEQRTHERRIESGKVSADDRMARARGYKWSTPQKGGEWKGLKVEGEDFPQLNDLASLRTEDNLKGFKPNIIDSSRLHTQNGRNTWAANTIVRAMQDLSNAGTDAANKQFLSSLHETIDSAKEQIEKQLATETDPKVREQLANHEMNRVRVHTMDGTPYEGWDDVATGKHYDTLPPIKNSVIHYDGRQAYILEFPEDSKVMHALRAMGTDVDFRDTPFFRSAIEASEAVINAPLRAANAGIRGLNKVAGTHLSEFAPQTHLIARSTRGLSQLWTIFRPTWNIIKLLPRSIHEKVLMYGVKEGTSVPDALGKMGSSLYHIIAGSFTPGTGHALRLLMAHDLQGLSEYGRANPGSWAHDWLKLQEGGGGSIFSEALPNTEAGNALVAAVKKGNRNVLTRAAHGYADYARGLADTVENISSVGAYRSMIARGMDEATAAVKTKQLLNFQKKGMATNMLAGVHGFYRVTMSVNDTMLQAFEHPLGRHEQNILGYKFTSGIDYHKLATTAAIMGSYAGLKYMLDRSLMGEDENGVNNMRKAIAQNPFVLIQNTFIPHPSDPGHPFLMAAGLGLPQLMSAPGKIAAALAYGDITAKQAGEMMSETLQHNASVMEPAGTPRDADMSTKAFAYAVQAFLPTLGQQAFPLFNNVNTMGDPIHTTRPQSDMFAADQGKPNTPQVWKDAAQHMQALTGVDYYPETLQYLASNFGGPLADLLRSSVALDTKKAQGLNAGGLAKGLGIEDTQADYYDSTRMYDVKDKLEETQQQLNAVIARSGHPVKSEEAKAAGEQWLAGNPKAQQRIDALKALGEAQKAYQKQISAIQNSNYSAEGRRLQRKQADSALRRATDTAQRVLKD